MVSRDERGSDFTDRTAEITHLEAFSSIPDSHSAMNSDEASVSCVIQLAPELNQEEASTSETTKCVDQDEDICRICHCNGEENELIRVCRCDGSTKFTHQHCLLSWYGRTARTTCELCLYDIKIYSHGLKPIRQWSSCFCCTEAEFVDHLPFFIIHVLVFIMFIMVAAVEQCFSATCIVFFLVCFGVSALTMYCCGGCKLFREYKLRWLMINVQWDVLKYDETNEEHGWQQPQH